MIPEKYKIIAAKGVNATAVGNEAHTKTMITIGVHPDQLKRYHEIKQIFEKNKINNESTAKALKVLERMKLMKKGLSGDKVVLKEKLEAMREA